MLHASPPKSVAAVAKTDDHAWRGRTFLACSLLAGGVIALGAANLDWSAGPAMALGQMAGMLAPLAVLGAAVWGVASAGRKP
jgi:hypothetical protein